MLNSIDFALAGAKPCAGLDARAGSTVLRGNGDQDENAEIK